MKSTGRSYLFLCGFAVAAVKNEVVVVGLLRVYLRTRTMIPLRTCFAKHPRDGAAGLDASFFTASA